jgi:aminoglycoside phosphotransferase family enzyme
LLPQPQPFDCIEFNDDYRQIDVLNEVAFLCMDLDAFQQQDLSDLFINSYNKLFPSMNTREDRKLFVYYKSYRANIRAKVNSLRARDTGSNGEKKFILAEVDKYLRLMDSYLKELE